MDIRPDVITKTGVIQPYAIREIPPTAVARTAVRAFENVGRSPGPQVRSEMGPAEFAAQAKRVAVALAAGKRMPKGTSPKLMQAARMIMEGKPFVVKSAGRQAVVKANPQLSGASMGLGAAEPSWMADARDRMMREAMIRGRRRGIMRRRAQPARRVVAPQKVAPRAAVMPSPTRQTPALPLRSVPPNIFRPRGHRQAYYQGSGTVRALSPIQLRRALG